MRGDSDESRNSQETSAVAAFRTKGKCPRKEQTWKFAPHPAGLGCTSVGEGVQWPRIRQSPGTPGPELVRRKLLAGQQGTSPQVSSSGSPAHWRRQSRPPPPGKKPFTPQALQSLQHPLLTKFSITLTFSKSLHISVHFLHCVLFHWFLLLSVLFPSFYLLWVYYVFPFLPSSGSMLDF